VIRGRVRADVEPPADRGVTQSVDQAVEDLALASGERGGEAVLGFATVYAAIAQRAYDEAVTRAHQRTSIALTRSMAYHPGVQHEIAEMRIALESIDGYLGSVIADSSNHVDNGMDWPVKILAAKHFAVNQAWQVVDSALDLSGGAGIFTRSRMQQMFRDARLGRIHPGNSLLTHEVVGKLSLGINPDEQPRWG
jgi:alkylation response protein AidB-like acyl-CoA dehydrogenase